MYRAVIALFELMRNKVSYQGASNKANLYRTVAGSFADKLVFWLVKTYIKAIKFK